MFIRDIRVLISNKKPLIHFAIQTLCAPVDSAHWPIEPLLPALTIIRQIKISYNTLNLSNALFAEESESVLAFLIGSVLLDLSAF